MAQKDLKARLALWRTPGVGPAVFRKILNKLASARDLFSQSASQLSSLGIKTAGCEYLLGSTLHSDIEKDLNWLADARDCERHIITLADSAYPKFLKQQLDAPPVLFVEGALEILDAPQLAVVGTRNPTASGKETARQFAASLAGNGVVITSGLAIGIDACAHWGALTGQGKTIAVLANGLDHLYPRQNMRLKQDIIAQGGAVISEFPVGVLPRKEYFPRRNRIISGLSFGVLVVEAAVRSGSLITARLAANQGKEVFAIPGSIHNPLAKGCHKLIREGATLVSQTEDILEVIYPLLQQDLADLSQKQWIETEATVTETAETEAVALTLDERQVMTALDFETASLDELVVRTGLSAGALLTHLMTLELKDQVVSVPGGFQKNVKTG